MPRDNLNDLVGETDAQIWTRAWLEAFAQKPDIAADEGTMIGWFANAIMAGYDMGRKAERRVDVGEKFREMMFQAAGAATAPLLADHPDYIFPSDKVKEAVDRVCVEFGIPTVEEDI